MNNMFTNNIKTVEFDALIIGGGGSGMRASLELAKSGLNTAVVSKVFPTRSHTVSAQGGITCAIASHDPEDDWRWHMYDTVKGADFIGDQDAIEYLCSEGPKAVFELEHMGLPFSRFENGRIYQRPFGGQSKDFGKGGQAARTCAAADRTGHALLHTLYQNNVKEGTNFLNEWFAVDLVKNSKDEVTGVIAFSIENGEVAYLKAQATVLATGGAGRIYASTTNALINTGDGLAMALRAGFPAQDMEMWQFHPTGIYGAGSLVTEGCRGEGGYLINKDGERFMERYAPSIKDLAPRDMVSRAIATEISQGNGAGPDSDYVYLDLTHLGAETIKKKLPDITDFVRTYVKIEPINEPIPVQPTAHYAMGGIPTDVNGRVLSDEKNTVLPGVYAAGEAACVSVHGANRLGTNSLLDIVVFGKRAGQSMLEYVSKTKSTSISDNAADDLVNKINNLIDKEHTDEFSVGRIRNDLQESMEENAKIFRSEETLSKQTKILENLRERYENVTIFDKGKVFNTELMEAIELDYLLDMSESTVASALARKESRGAHSRQDFIDRDDSNFMKHSFAFKNGNSANLRYKDVELGKYEPMERKY